jgi:hypothetical protein
MPARKKARSAGKSDRALQKQVAKADSKRPRRKVEGAVQAGARHYPEPPFPKSYSGA